MLEDDPDDLFITEAELQKLGYNISLRFVRTSTELFSFLENDEKPFLIILDYNSSPLNAVQIIKQLKDDSRFKGTPVVVLGDSSLSKYVSECYEAGASSYIQKPSSMEATTHKIDNFFTYWIQTVEV